MNGVATVARGFAYVRVSTTGQAVQNRIGELVSGSGLIVSHSAVWR
jgi:hypothetical protein